MATTAQNVIDLVRGELDDQSANFITNADLLKHIQEANKDLPATYLDYTEGVLTTVATQADYAMPTDSRELNSVTLDGVPLIYASKQGLLADGYTLTDAGEPTHYYSYGAKIKLYPVPDAIYTGTFDYFKWRTAITQVGDSLTLPDDCGKVIVDYCLYRIYLKALRAPSIAQAYLEQYLTRKNDLTLFPKELPNEESGPFSVRLVW